MRENFTDGKTHILKRWRLPSGLPTSENLNLYFLESGGHAGAEAMPHVDEPRDP